jgi:polyisoprenoid-binding protein YceI
VKAEAEQAITHRFRAIPERSEIRIEARSSLHPIHGQATGIRGEAEIAVRDGRIDLSVPPRARIELPVEKLSSGNTLQDMQMRRTIDARKYPTITCELAKATALAEPNRYRVQFDLTFHGIARRLEANATATLDDRGVLAVEGECVIDVRAFNITPPRILGLQVYPDVKVRGRIVLERVG